jgi:hypothetical protein
MCLNNCGGILEKRNIFRQRLLKGGVKIGSLSHTRESTCFYFSFYFADALNLKSV